MTQKEQMDEAMLHAYVDGELDPESRREVEAWLAQHPQDADRVASWKQQINAFKDLFDPVAEEPIPAQIQATLGSRHRGAFMRQIRRVAAALVLFTAGSGAGWIAATRTGHVAQPDSSIASQALSAHIVYASEVRHPVEVTSKEKAHLIGWLSKRLGQPLIAPDLTPKGFELIGGRLLPDAKGPAAQFMYEDRTGQRVTVYVGANASGTNTAFRINGRGAVKSFYWLDGPLGYAVSGEIEQKTLLSIAKKAYEQLASDT